MGVKGLSQVINKLAPSAITPYDSLAALPLRRLAIDTNLLLNKLHFSRPVLELGARRRHLNHDLYHFCQLLERGGFVPIFVFDGVGRVPHKMKEVQRRVAARKLQMERKIAEEERGRHLQQTVTLSTRLSNRASESKSRQPMPYPLMLPIAQAAAPVEVPPPEPPAERVELGAELELGETPNAPLIDHLEQYTSLKVDVPTPHVDTSDIPAERASSSGISVFGRVLQALNRALFGVDRASTVQDLPSTPSPPPDTSTTSSASPSSPVSPTPLKDRSVPLFPPSPELPCISSIRVEVTVPPAVPSPLPSPLPTRPEATSLPSVFPPHASPAPPTPTAPPPSPTPPPPQSAPTQATPPSPPTYPVVYPSSPPPQSTEILESAAASQLEMLQDHFRVDLDNPIYSKNQRKLARQVERAVSAITPPATSSSDEKDEEPAEGRGGWVWHDDEDDWLSVEEMHERGWYEDKEAVVEAEADDSGRAELSAFIEASKVLEARHRRYSEPLPYGALTDAEALIQALGFPVVKPSPDRPHEAEGLCSTLYSLGLIDYVVSEDTDVAVYQAPLLRKINILRNPGRPLGEGEIEPQLTKQMNLLDTVALRSELELSSEEFVEFALLCGTDFTERIPRVGPTRAYKVIREFGSIENYLASPTAKYLPDDLEQYIREVNGARAIFREPPPLPQDYSLQRRRPARDLARQLRAWGVESGDVEDQWR